MNDESSYRFWHQLWLLNEQIEEKRIADQIALSIKNQILVRGIRVVSRNADTVETERMAACVRHLSSDLKNTVQAVCSDSKSAIFVVALFDGQRSRAQSVANLLSGAIWKEFEIHSTVYVFDEHGPVGVLEKRQIP